MKTSEKAVITTPGQLVAQRFMRNKLAIAGLCMLFAMLILVFLGPFLSPYGEYEIFYQHNGEEITDLKEFYANIGISQEELAEYAPELAEELADAGMLDDVFEEAADVTTSLGVAVTESAVINETDRDITEFSDEFDNTIFTENETITENGEETVISAETTSAETDKKLPPRMQQQAEEKAVTTVPQENQTQNTSDESIGQESAAASAIKGVKLYDKQPPSLRHWLGTDRNGHDMFTRLMYGGRISMIIGLICVIIQIFLGMTLGGISGYYGGWVDMVIMRLVEVFYCIPSLPVVLLVGTIMRAMNVTVEARIYVLMIIIGFLGWASVARITRGQILSLREQEYMLAAEATGLKTYRRIFKHLLPNVMPQLIVIATLGIGDVILFEAFLSYLGLGVPLPYSSWGNMVEVVGDTQIMRNNLSMWVPPGLCILSTVMAFNFLGDGLRDAFDPKMKR